MSHIINIDVCAFKLRNKRSNNCNKSLHCYIQNTFLKKQAFIINSLVSLTALVYSVVMFMLKAVTHCAVPFVSSIPNGPYVSRTYEYDQMSLLSLYNPTMSEQIYYTSNCLITFFFIWWKVWRANQSISLYTQMIYFLHRHKSLYQCNVITFPNIHFFFSQKLQ